MAKKLLLAVIVLLAGLALLGYKYYELVRWVNGLVRPAARVLHPETSPGRVPPK